MEQIRRWILFRSQRVANANNFHVIRELTLLFFLAPFFLSFFFKSALNFQTVLAKCKRSNTPPENILTKKKKVLQG